MQKKSNILLLLTGLLLLISNPGAGASFQPDVKLFKYWFGNNKYDGGGNFHGKWVFYHDEEETVLMRKGRFKHGQQRGVWTYYLEDGTLYRKEKYKSGDPLSRVLTKLYHPNGKVAVKGKALQYEDHLKIHYYWDGNWRYYAENGKLEKTVRYSKGNLVQTKSLAPEMAEE
jgi:antitoxin component YwqK of YwqJK toxin-antitoxin module